MNETFKTLLLLASLSGLLLLIGDLVGGPTGLSVMLFFALLMNFASWFWSDKFVLALYRAKPFDDPELKRIVSHLSRKAGIPVPRLFLIESATPNAFATGRSPKHSAVAVTTGLLSLLNKQELEGVLAHEISHIKHRDTLTSTIAATIATVISYLAFMARWAAIFGGFGRDDRDGSNIFELLFLAIIAPLAATIIQLAISRSREFAADASAARLQGTGKYLASALLKLEKGVSVRPLNSNASATSSLFIVNPFSAKGFVKLFSTHPPVEERVARLRSL